MEMNPDRFMTRELPNLLKRSRNELANFINAANGREYAIPNRLTSRRINLKLIASF